MTEQVKIQVSTPFIKMRIHSLLLHKYKEKGEDRKGNERERTIGTESAKEDSKTVVEYNHKQPCKNNYLFRDLYNLFESTDSLL